MISRLMLSLKKAADPQRGGWSFGESPANGTNLSTVQFARARGGDGSTEDGVPIGPEHEQHP